MISPLTLTQILLSRERAAGAASEARLDIGEPDIIRASDRGLLRRLSLRLTRAECEQGGPVLEPEEAIRRLIERGLSQ